MGERLHPRAATPPPFQESNAGTLEPSGHCLSFSMLRNFLTSKTGNNLVVELYTLMWLVHTMYKDRDSRQKMCGLPSGRWLENKMTKEGDTLENGCEKGRMRVYNNNNNNKAKISFRRNNENLQ